MQCGFKAMPTVLAKKLIPKVKNNKWLFDSELLINAKNQKVKIKSVPITWNESPSTTVKFLKLASEMMKFINRMSVTQKRIITPERLLLVGLMLIASSMGESLLFGCYTIGVNKLESIFIWWV